MGKEERTNQMLNPPSCFPGVFIQISCRKSVHSPLLNDQDPRPIDMPVLELQYEIGPRVQVAVVCLSLGA